jgi:hypothetical protein
MSMMPPASPARNRAFARQHSLRGKNPMVLSLENKWQFLLQLAIVR